MIISASRRTDIPAFHAEWFMKRIREGYFHRVNPFNSRQVSGFSLKPEDVDAICFWSKNPRQLMKYLDELNERGFNYYFQFTLNPYDKTFEPHVPPLPERIETMLELAGRIGPERVVWRYDPVILSSISPVSWHLDQAEQIAGRLQGATRRLVFSFYDYYGKGEGRLSRTLKGTGITLEDITAPGQSEALGMVVRGFKAIADRHNLRISTCCEHVDLAAEGILHGASFPTRRSSDLGILHGACIDGDLIRELFGATIHTNRDKNQRTDCNCVEAADMGIYNSCRFRCAYCYANFNDGVIERNFRKNLPDTPALLFESGGDVEIRTRDFKK